VRRRATFAAFRHRNYRLWFAGQMVSLLGSWMQITAQGFLVYELTRSTVYLGFVSFAAGIPPWLFALYGGVIADRVSRRSLLIVTQTAMMLLAFVLAGLTFAHLVRPWHIVALAFGLGMANAFDAPARQAFVVELVARENLTNAIALNSTMFNIGTTIGPAAAGLLYAAVGPAWCFALNGLSFIAVIAALAAMLLPRPARMAAGRSAVRELLYGLRFVARHRVIRTLIIALGLMSLFGFSLMSLMPAWATSVLGGDARTNGWLLSARGLGSLAGAVMIASLASTTRKGALRALGSFLVPVSLIAFAAVRALSLSLLFLAAAGWAFMVFFNSTNALVQMHVPDELRGRVMSIYTLTFFGLMPVGALMAGAVAAHLGAPWTVVVTSLVLMLAALVVWWRVPELTRLP
jgi:MFS family permease